MANARIGRSTAHSPVTRSKSGPFLVLGWGVPNPFTRPAVEKIHDLSHGVPRRILAVASAAYDLREMAGKARLDADLVAACYATNDKPENTEVV
jgi:hypothetical protein